MKPGGDHKPPASILSDAPKGNSPPQDKGQAGSPHNGMPISRSASPSPSPMSGTNQIQSIQKPQPQGSASGPSPGRQASPQPAPPVQKIVAKL